MSKQFILISLLASFLAFGESANAFELVKCNSNKFGTLWASFGRQWRSGEKEPLYFPTEIVVFAPNYSYRKVYNSLPEALMIEVVFTSSSFKIVFPSGDQGESNNLLDLSIYDRLDPSGFLGIWSKSEGEKKFETDTVACSIY